MPKTRPLPPLAFLNESFRIVENSRLFWRDGRPLGHFKDAGYHRRWTTRFAGKEAGTVCKRDGYRVVCLSHNGLAKLLRAHRVIWALHHQGLPCPTLDIDHINGVRADNHVGNLRLVAHLDNLRNAKMRSDNTTGINGVSWHKAKGKWMAHIRIEGKSKHLGYFDDIEEAAVVRKAANVEHGFTDRHGEEL